MTDLERIKHLSGLTESFDGGEETIQDGIESLFTQLLTSLKEEYASDENIQGMVYHFEESLANLHADHDETYDGSDGPSEW